MPAPSIEQLSFDKQIEYFRNKLNLSTNRWDDIWQEQHAKAFMVAGAAKTELLTDLRGAMQKSIEKGTTYQEFVADFKNIAARHGWGYKGSSAWRSRVIYETNMNQSYNAGRYKQQQDIKDKMPYLQYHHSHASTNPRAQHLAWDKMILPVDDQFWDTHYPANGWGCKCRVFALDEAAAKAQGINQSPKITWVNQLVGDRVVKTPKGISPGFAYNVGKASFGQIISKQVMDAYIPKNWIPLNPTTYLDYGLDDLKPQPTALRPLNSNVNAVDYIKKTIGANETILKTKAGHILLNAKVLGNYVNTKPKRSRYLPFLLDSLHNPQEVWMLFEKNAKTGKVQLRQRYIKRFDISNNLNFIAVTQVNKGFLEAWNLVLDKQQITTISTKTE